MENAKKIAGGAVTVLFGRALLPIRRDLRVEQKLDETRREGVMRAHSATHLLNWALQKLGVGSGQKGSSVGKPFGVLLRENKKRRFADCDRFRFDYSTGDEDLSKEQRTELLIKCEMKMREFIQNGGFTEIIETSLEEAKKIENLQSDVKEDRIGGASVRVVALGSGADVPVECCSGT